MSKIKLGIADDKRDFCDILADYFSTQDNIEISFIVHDGLDAVEEVKKNLPEILLLDMIMPRLDGLGVLELINSTELERYPKVIVLFISNTSYVLYKRCCMNAYIRQ